MNTNRRDFFKKALYATGFIPFLKVADLMAAAKCPQEAPKTKKVTAKLLDPKGSTAKRLKFVTNAKDGKGTKKWEEGAQCGTCKFFKGEDKKKDPGYAKCALAGNKYVPACGWCKSYKLDKKKV